MIPIKIEKPMATATIEALGPRTGGARRHEITVAIRLSGVDSKHADEGQLAGLARRSLAGFGLADVAPEARPVAKMTLPSTIATKTGAPPRMVVGVQCSAIWPDRPDDELVDAARAVLAAAGYRVKVTEKRDCAEPSCTSEVVADWYQPSKVPLGWYSSLICGKHNYRECGKCRSLYVMTNSSAEGQTPSVQCEVCGETLVAWGGSKTWNAQLVTRGDAAPQAPAAPQR
jgi:hypothetical protein